MIRNVLMEFQELSSLYPNPNKSDIFLSGMLDVERDQIIRILGLERGSFLSHQGLRLFIVRVSWIESPLNFGIGLVEHSRS
jgi:hypothetical protein